MYKFSCNYCASALTFAVLLISLSLSCLPAFAQDKASISGQQTVQIGSALDRAPYILQNERSGLELDIVRLAFANQSIKVEFQFSSRNRQLLHLSQQKVDAIMTVNKHLEVEGYPSDTYISYHNMAISLASNNLVINKVEDLAHYSVIAFLNAQNVLGDNFKKMSLNNRSYQEVSPQEKQNKMLYLQRVDVVIADKYVFKGSNSLIANDIDTSPKLNYHNVFAGPEYYLSFHDQKLRDTFNQGLKNIRRNGLYQKLEKQYRSDK